MVYCQVCFSPAEYALILSFPFLCVFPNFIPENFAVFKLSKLLHHKSVAPLPKTRRFSNYLCVLPKNQIPNTLNYWRRHILPVKTLEDYRFISLIFYESRWGFPILVFFRCFSATFWHSNTCFLLDVGKSLIT